MQATVTVCILALASADRAHQSLRVSKSAPDEAFGRFMQDFSRDYASGTQEYQQRLALFQDTLQRIETTNAKNAREGRPWQAGPNAFMDWSAEERRSLHGYKPPQTQRGGRNAPSVLAGLQVSNSGSSHSRMNMSRGDAVDSFTGAGAQHRNQGNCGSCWAISATEAVEAQLRKQGQDVRVGAQALLDCMPNPQHCGGTGGCDGANGELAFGFMQKYGLPLDSDLPYKARAGTCQMDSDAVKYPTKRRAVISGWTNLPSNKAEPLKDALVKTGAVVVAVDGSDWIEYSKGIFDGCSKDATLSHAVLAKGFGAEGDKSYWTIQNSWGQHWGENGDIRLQRHEDEDSWCGTDSDPKKGTACDGGPDSVTVCGMCGLLYDPLYPEDVRIEDDAVQGSMARVTAGDYTPWRPS